MVNIKIRPPYFHESCGCTYRVSVKLYKLRVSETFNHPHFGEQNTTFQAL